LRAVGLRK